MLSVVGIGVILAVFGFSQAKLSDEYQNSIRLDNEAEPSYMLYWTYNSNDSTISIAVQAKALGWVGFGFANKIDEMKGYDVVMGYIDKTSELKVCIFSIVIIFPTNLLKYM
jgi:hypothetical protein